MFFHVSARKLHETDLIDSEEYRCKVSVFPFFNRAGRVVLNLITIPDQGNAYLLYPRKEQLRVAFRAVRLSCRLTALDRMDTSLIREFGGLYHYDPWWVLRHPFYEKYRWVPALKATNCAERFTVDVNNVYFDKRLGELRYLDIRDEETMFRYQPKYLQHPIHTLAHGHGRIPNGVSTPRGYALKKGIWRLRAF